MSAPLTKSSGAPVAQTHLKTSAPLVNFPYSKTALAQSARHCAAALAHQRRSKGSFTATGKIPASNARGISMAKVRPKRPAKFDRWTAPAATPEETAINLALAPFDERGREMEAKWGIDRLPGLVSPELAQRWGTTIANLNRAMHEGTPDDVVACVASALRGLEVMDAEAARSGHKPATGEVWEYDCDGFRFGVMRDGREWRAAQAQHPDLRLFTLREVGVALKAINAGHPLIESAKKIGGAEIVKISEKIDRPNLDLGGDEIPF